MMQNGMLENKYGLKLEYQSGKIEIGVDEAGRGPLFGRLYVAAVVLPKDGSFDFSEVRDSKKITSKKKIAELAEKIKTHSLAWHIEYVESIEIDTINIRQAVLKAMRQCIHQVLKQLGEPDTDQVFLLIDGNDFPAYTVFKNDTWTTISHETIAGGDNLYAAIACASILAKTARDEYILQLCEEYPDLKTRYKLDQNMGYGTKHHLEGILQHGISQWHRKTYGRCKEAMLSIIPEK